MNQYRQEELKKKSDQKMNMLGLTSDLSALLKKKSKVDTHPQHLVIKVNIEYLNILLPHLKHYNAYCALCICTRYFGKNISQPTTLLLRCTLKCSGHVLNNGYCVLIATNRKIFHRVNEKISRPIRGSQRRAIMDKFKAGGSVYRIHPQYDEKITIHGKKVLILMQLASRKKLYDSIVNCSEYVLSWNATGGIAKNSSSKQCLYYELTITHPNIVDEDSLVPLTFRLSESQTLFTVKQWLLSFKECYRK
ncbi:unnamed protein product, partial [Rotaria magnacalcarata]